MGQGISKIKNPAQFNPKNWPGFYYTKENYLINHMALVMSSVPPYWLWMAAL